MNHLGAAAKNGGINNLNNLNNINNNNLNTINSRGLSSREKIRPL
jgi:hypothetical protein